jgi:hypothetical protein
MGLFGNRGVNRRVGLCGVPESTSAQSVDFLVLYRNSSFRPRKLRGAHPAFRDGRYLAQPPLQHRPRRASERLPRTGASSRLEGMKRLLEMALCSGVVVALSSCSVVTGGGSDCFASAECARDGLCVSRRGQCTAGDGKDCKKAEACKNHGRCAARDGNCVATSGNLCRKSRGCHYEGRCSLGEGVCVVAAHKDCAKAKVCTIYGQCGLQNGACAVPITDAHCRKARICMSENKCWNRGGVCADRAPGGP